jgi:hypothetical protein
MKHVEIKILFNIILNYNFINRNKSENGSTQGSLPGQLDFFASDWKIAG